MLDHWVIDQSHARTHCSKSEAERVLSEIGALGAHSRSRLMDLDGRDTIVFHDTIAAIREAGIEE